MRKADLIIILGGGVNNTLTPVLYTKERLEDFLKRKKQFWKTPVIVSGGYSVWTKKPRYTEAEVMKNFLRKNGFSNVISEDKSRDTVGNVYFSKQIIKKHPGWKNILIVTTKGHKIRSGWLFKKFFGPSYKFSFIEIPSKTKGFALKRRKDYELYVLGVYKRMLDEFRPGDDERIIEKLKRYHPAFSKSEAARKIAEEINAAKQRYLGYTKAI